MATGCPYLAVQNIDIEWLLFVFMYRMSLSLYICIDTPAWTFDINLENIAFTIRVAMGKLNQKLHVCILVIRIRLVCGVLMPSRSITLGLSIF